jgi:hypothetical protein
MNYTAGAIHPLQVRLSNAEFGDVYCTRENHKMTTVE